MISFLFYTKIGNGEAWYKQNNRKEGIFVFKNLNNYGYKRSGLEALGFLIVFSLVGLLIGAVSNLVLSIVLNLPMNTTQDGFETIKHTHKYIILISGIYVSTINIIIAKSKYCLNKISSIVSILISFCIGLLFGCILGLIPSAIMTTKEICSEHNDETVQNT